jgi:hypothetical protein
MAGKDSWKYMKNREKATARRTPGDGHKALAGTVRG